MKKFHWFIITVAMAFQVNAQSDSTRKFRISGFQLDMSLLGSNENMGSQQKFQQYVKQNALLNSDLSGYDGNQFGYTTHDVNGHVGAKVFIDLPVRLKKQKLQLALGLRFGSVTLSSAYYSKQSYDTTGVYINPSNNSKLTLVDQYYSSYNYSIYSKQILVPVGLNISSNMKKRFWFTAGVEIAPGITFSNHFMANYNVSKTGLILNEQSNLKDYRTFSRSAPESLLSEHSGKQVKGIGFTGYATIPLSVNLRLAKRIKFLNHLNLSASVAPGVYMMSNKFSGTGSNFVINSSIGLRYNLR